MNRTVVALFDRIDDARMAVEELVRMGIRRDDISLIASDAHGDFKRYQSGESFGEDVAEDAVQGAGIGAALGGLTGLLVGLGALTIPGIGPLIAAGPIAAALAGAGIGAAAGGLIGALTNLGIPEEQASLYAEGIRRGGSLVSVSTPEDQSVRVADILNRFNPVDLNTRRTFWEERNWTGFDPDLEPYTYDEIERERSEYSTWSQTHGSSIPMGSGQSTTLSDYSSYEPRFRSHYETTFGGSSYMYDDYAPAYRYGYDMASSNRYTGRHWEDIERDLRSDWETRYPRNAWEDFKGAVRAAWETVTLQR